MRILKLKSELEDRLRDLTSQFHKVVPPTTEQSTELTNHAQLENSIDLAVQSINTDFATQRAIRAALERIERGDYGICELCGEPIPIKRLMAIPWASTCVMCQAGTEQRGQWP